MWAKLEIVWRIVMLTSKKMLTSFLQLFMLLMVVILVVFIGRQIPQRTYRPGLNNQTFLGKE